MADFVTSLDIANRACQQCGVKRITSPDLLTTDGSVQWAEFAFNYDKLRRAELRRNTWTFSIKLVALRPVTATTLILRPDAWAIDKEYGVGSIVAYDNRMWQSTTPANRGNQPNNSPLWDIYFGPIAVEPYDTTGKTSYYAGELVYVANNQGVTYVFSSNQNSNSTNPSAPPTYSATTTYLEGQVVEFGGFNYLSLFNVNMGNRPDLTPAPWQPTINYEAANTVLGIDGLVYYAAQNNIGHAPTTDAASVYWATYGVKGAWAPNFSGPYVSAAWTLVGASLAQPALIYPIGTGPSWQGTTRNVYLLPNGFLREAPSDPKSGSYSYLGAPSGLAYSDFEFQSGVIVSFHGEPIILRFVADITNVTKMEDMFCEGLAARLGFETVERLTQATSKRGAIFSAYKTFMTEARMVNAIEQGPVEIPVDDYITCRR